MHTFLISYDLAKPNTNKHAMTTAIMMLGKSWARPLEQIWYIRTDIDARDVETVLSRVLDDDDGLLVQCVEHDAVLANTELRWFRQRSQRDASDEINIVAFPVVADIAA